MKILTKEQLKEFLGIRAKPSLPLVKMKRKRERGKRIAKRKRRVMKRKNEVWPK